MEDKIAPNGFKYEFIDARYKGDYFLSSKNYIETVNTEKEGNWYVQKIYSLKLVKNYKQL